MIQKNAQDLQLEKASRAKELKAELLQLKEQQRRHREALAAQKQKALEELLEAKKQYQLLKERRELRLKNALSASRSVKTQRDQSLQPKQAVTLPNARLRGSQSQHVLQQPKSKVQTSSR